MPTEGGPSWSLASLQPYFEHIVKSFGPKRMLFGGNWSVCCCCSSLTSHRCAAASSPARPTSFARFVVTQYATFLYWAETAMQLILDLSADEKAAILGDNAVKFYKMA